MIESIILKQCGCGCGQSITQIDSRGRERNYLRGHGNKGENNGQWKENVSYTALHGRIKRLLPEPELCPSCDRKIKVDLCNVSKESNIIERYEARDPVILATYNMDLKSWYYSCRECHMDGDGRWKNLKQFQFRSIN